MKTIEELRNAADRLGRGHSMGSDAETIDEAIVELERLRMATAADHDAQCKHFIEAVGLVARTAELEATLETFVGTVANVHRALSEGL